MSIVYFFESDSESFDPKELADVLEPLFGELSDGKTALKLHFGERKGDTYLKPRWVEPIYNSLDRKSKECVLLECTVLYKSPRAFASTHKEVARENGFTFAPIVIADGERGNDETEVEIEGEIFDRVKLGSSLDNYDSLVVLTHFTGHLGSGFGGALKNIGMGLGSKAGKMEMHGNFDLKISSNKCVACGECVDHCPEEAISIFSKGFPTNSKTASIDKEKCVGCGSCIAVCPEEAVKIPWASRSRRGLQERISEYAKGVVKNRNTLFVNFLLNITKKCDCVNKKQEPFTDDIGVLVSEDPVAVDQASIDIIGKSKFMISEMMVSPDRQLKHAEKIELGEREYEIRSLN